MTSPMIITMGQGSASKHVPIQRTICISIRSPGSPQPELMPGYVDVLYLQFEDDCVDGWETRDRGMTANQAKLVVKFIEKNRGKFDVVLVHCFVGVSRSVSLACALTRADVGRYVSLGKIPNRNVYITTLRAFRGMENAA